MAAENLPLTARLHVSQIPFDISEERLRARFAKYGRVFEVCLRKGFAFIQLGTEEEADRAIATENGSMFEGRRIRVSLTNKTRSGKAINSDVGYTGGGREKNPYESSTDREMSRFGDRDLPARPRERSPLRDRYGDRFLDRYDDPLRDPYERDLRKRDRYFDERLTPNRDRFEERYLPEEDYRRDIAYRDRDRLADRDRDRDRLDRDRRDSLDRSRRDIADREKELRDHYDRRPLPGRSSDPSPRRASPGPSPSALPLDDKPIDCEILLLGKHLRDYADMVERRLKGLALNTGLLLISIEASLPQALEDVTRRKVLYAIILTTQNEVHRSVTLNILHGSPQEHRNMPLEDALSLVERNYTNYLQDRSAPAKLPPKPALPHAAPALAAAAAQAVPPLPSDPIQPRVQAPLPTAAPPTPASAMVIPNVELTIPQLINLLADRKQLTIQEMDRVISHLQAVRRKMALEQGVDTDPVQIQSTQPKAMTDNPVQQAPVDSKHNELQAKILSIIHPGAGSSATSAPTKTTATMSSTPNVTNMGFNTTSPAASAPSSRPAAGTPLPFSYGGSLTSVSGTPPASKSPAVSANKNINLDSPIVQKALDNLIQSGPTMLKQLATSSNMTKSINTMSKAQASNKAILDIKNVVSAKKPTGPNKEQNEAQLRAAQTAALQTLQQQQQQQQQLKQQQQMQQQAVLAVQAHMAQQKQATQSTSPSQQLQQQQQQQQQQLMQYPQQAQYQQQQLQYQQQQAQYQQQQAQYLQQQQAQYQQLQQQQGQSQQLASQMSVQGMGAQMMGPNMRMNVPQTNVGQTMAAANMGPGVVGGNAMMQGGAGWPRGQQQQQRQPTPSYQQNQAKKANSNPQQAYSWSSNQPVPPGT